MKEELDNLYEEMKKEIDSLEIKQNKNTLNNKSNQPYWDIEKKYKEKIKQIKEKYNK